MGRAANRPGLQIWSTWCCRLAGTVRCLWVETSVGAGAAEDVERGAVVDAAVDAGAADGGVDSAASRVLDGSLPQAASAMTVARAAARFRVLRVVLMVSLSR
jgi:hypothetical protein